MKLPLLITVVTFGVVYFLIEKAGLFSDTPSSCIEIVYSFPILIASLFLLPIVAVSALKDFRGSIVTGGIKVISALLIVGGLWLGHFTRFSGEVVLTEGQSLYSGHSEYMSETFYRGRYADDPDLVLKLVKLSPSFSSDGEKIEKLSGTMQFLNKETKKPEEHTLTDGFPSLIKGMLFRLRDFGYSPRYALKTKDGRVLDSSFMYMRLFPPGSEDYFRLLSPLTYYLRYYPDGKNDRKEPLFRLRIVRNKDIVFNGDITLSEEALFENSRLSVEEVRMWTRLSIKHDWGEVLVFGGLILGCVHLAMVLLSKKQPDVKKAGEGQTFNL